MNKKKIAIMYDFDKTLCSMDMQDYGFIKDLKQDSFSFWNEVNEFAKTNNMDQILACMYYMVQSAKKHGITLTRDRLNEYGSQVELCKGLDTWFDRINLFAKNNGIEVEHYIISSGLKEIIDGTGISDKFKKVFACEYHYDENGIIDWPKLAINYTSKTQFLFRINKGVLDISDDEGVNQLIPEDERSIPFENMIYIGDGMTDIPCMQLIRDRHGYSIAVYQKNDKTAKGLMRDNRVDYIAHANYEDNEMLDVIVKRIIKEKSNEL